MKQIIGKKQTSSNDDFVKAWNEIESLVSRQEAQALVDHAVATSGSRRQANEPDTLGAEERTVSPCNTSVKRLALQIVLSA